MKKFLSIIGGIISFGICAVLFALELFFLTFTSFKSLLNEKTISNFLEDTDVVEILQTNDEVMEAVYKASGSIGLTIDETDKLLNSKALKDFASEYVSNNIKGLYTDAKTGLNASDIQELMSDIETETNINIRNKDKLLVMINENINVIEEKTDISNNIKSQLDETTLNGVKFLMGPNVLIPFMVLFVIIYLLICLFRWSIYKPFIWIGITSVISGLLFIIPSLSFSAILPYIMTEDLSKYQVLLDSVLKVIQSKFILSSVIAIIVGVLLIVGYALIRNKKPKDETTEKLETL